MGSGRSAKPLGVVRAGTALRSLGRTNAAFVLRDAEGGSRFADCSGDVSGSDVYVGLTGGSPTAPSVRLLLDGRVFEDVAGGDVGEPLPGISSGRATIAKRRSPFSSAWALEHAVGAARHFAAGRFGSAEEPQSRERTLVAEWHGKRTRGRESAAVPDPVGCPTRAVRVGQPTGPGREPAAFGGACGVAGTVADRRGRR